MSSKIRVKFADISNSPLNPKHCENEPIPRVLTDPGIVNFPTNPEH